MNIESKNVNNKMAKTKNNVPTQPFEIQTFRIGDVAIVAYPGEMFVDYQLTLDQNAPFDKTITLGYSNGCIGYVPTADAYPKVVMKLNKPSNIMAP